MKELKHTTVKRSGKMERERKVLLGVIEFYIKTGKPVGSNTLKEAGFGDLSSATIRNYFAKLEEENYIVQQHASSGRIPTEKAFRFYAHEYMESDLPLLADNEILTDLRNIETREIAGYLQQAADHLSHITQSAVFLSSPRFDHDFIARICIVPIDHSRCLCVLITDFGVIQTEVLKTNKKLTAFTVKRLEEYFHWRLTNNDKPENLSEEEEKMGQAYYNELMVRYIVGYSNFTGEETYRTGFSKLLEYPEFHDPIVLSSSLALFENAQSMRQLLKECSKVNRLRLWIGDDLAPFTLDKSSCSVLAMPYHINQQAVGAVGLLGPVRMPYRQLFRLLRAFSESISTALTRNIYKFKLSFRQPHQGASYLQSAERHTIGQSRLMLLEDKSL